MKIRFAISFVALISMVLSARGAAEEAFWSWFVKNQVRFDHFERDQDALLDELGRALESYRAGLVFEISAKEAGVREFVISADGIEELFPSVLALTSAAPALDGWKITAFRPRMDDYSRYTLEYEGRPFDPSAIWFYSRIKGGKFDVIFYHPSYRDEDRNLITSGTYILLDMAIGEYDVVTGIHQLDHQLLPENPEKEELRPFSEFRSAFDEYKKKRQG